MQKLKVGFLNMSAEVKCYDSVNINCINLQTSDHRLIEYLKLEWTHKHHQV